MSFTPSLKFPDSWPWSAGPSIWKASKFHGCNLSTQGFWEMGRRKYPALEEIGVDKCQHAASEVSFSIRAMVS